jgi:hypothetical protein
MCLDGGGGHSPQTPKYLVYELPGKSSLIGIECTTGRDYLRVGFTHSYFSWFQVAFVLKNLWRALWSRV